MNSELYNLKHPNRKKIQWIVFYLIISFLFLMGLYIFADHIKTRSLPAGYINVKILQSKYLVGEPVKVKVNNNFSTPIYVGNECPEEPLAVYRLDGDKWNRIHQDADIKDCKGQDREILLAANSYAIVDFSPWQKMFMTPGKYRIVALVEHYNSLPYEDFEVVEPTANPATNKASPDSPEDQQDVDYEEPAQYREPEGYDDD